MWVIMCLYFLLELSINARSYPQDLMGPGWDSPVMERAEDMQSQDLPMEHRTKETEMKLDQPPDIKLDLTNIKLDLPEIKLDLPDIKMDLPDIFSIPRMKRDGKLILPDIFSIPRPLTRGLSVDLFFSLFFVFLNNEWEESKDESIILAPANLSSKKATRWLESDEALTEQLLLSHIILGERIRPETLVVKQTKTTLSGLKVIFELNDNGSILVNGVRVTALEKYNNITILALEDEIVKDVFEEFDKSVLQTSSKSSSDDGSSTSSSDEVSPMSSSTQVSSEFSENVPTNNLKENSIADKEMQEKQTSKEVLIPTPRNSSRRNCTKVGGEPELSIFKSIEVCSETFQRSDDQDEGRQVGKEPLHHQSTGTADLDLVEQLASLTSFFNGGPPVERFIHLAREFGLADRLEKDLEYTFLAPTDQAFREWEPIDWGFNPFDVEEFVNQTLSNHVIKGAVVLDNIKDGLELETLGGKQIRFEVNPETVYVNRVGTEGELRLLRGNVVFIQDVLFLDDDVLDSLNQQFKYLESGPLITYPWFKSQFLSHSFRILEPRPEFSLMLEYMNMTPSLGDHAQSYYEPGTVKGYTMFVPRDDAFWKIQLVDAAAPDPFIQDEDVRASMLLGHLVQGTLLTSDLADSTSLRTQANTTLRIINDETGTRLHDGVKEVGILGDPIFVYNLGVLIPLDSVLFFETSDVIAAIEKLEPGETSESDDIEEVLDENEESKPKNEDEVTKSEVHNSPDSGAGSENAEKNTENIDFPVLEAEALELPEEESLEHNTNTSLDKTKETTGDNNNSQEPQENDQTEFQEEQNLKEKGYRRIDGPSIQLTDLFNQLDSKNNVLSRGLDEAITFPEQQKRIKVVYVNNTRIELVY